MPDTTLKNTCSCCRKHPKMREVRWLTTGLTDQSIQQGEKPKFVPQINEKKNVNEKKNKKKAKKNKKIVKILSLDKKKKLMMLREESLNVF